mmetsp:Transcript_15351/g.30993  ORF Transcript_15351/g.30993 Transcript_15351/m.30993 type:complete len:142 (+) Transcript_15351:877-1302(+)
MDSFSSMLNSGTLHSGEIEDDRERRANKGGKAVQKRIRNAMKANADDASEEDRHLVLTRLENLDAGREASHAKNRKEWHESTERYESWKKAHLREEPKKRRGDESEDTRIANWASKQRRKAVGGKRKFCTRSTLASHFCVH